MRVVQVFNALRGEWKLQRTVSNSGRMEGIATFKGLHNNELLYREEGIYISLTGQQFNVFRNYIYRYLNNKIHIFFYDGKASSQLFQSLDPLVCTTIYFKAKAIHLCGKDQYKTIYRFNNQNEFKMICSVKGPVKNYTITSQFDRLI